VILGKTEDTKICVNIGIFLAFKSRTPLMEFNKQQLASMSSLITMLYLDDGF
jgi:hypothetical protein